MSLSKPQRKSVKPVQGTNDSSIISKLSMCEAGYFLDPYLKHFVARHLRRTPLINRGYYIRAMAVTHTLKMFLEHYSDVDTQVISLGAGFDSCYFRLCGEGRMAHCKFFEVDFPSTMQHKLSIILTTPELSCMVPNVSSRGDKVTVSDHYCIIGCDLYQLDEFQTLLKLADVDYTIPTLLLSECVLTYMDVSRVNALLSWSAKSFSNAVFCTYEQSGVMDEVPLEIVDTHMHLWSPGTHSWAKKLKDGTLPLGNLELVESYLPENYKHDLEGFTVSHSIHVEVVWPGDPVGETRWLDGLADSNSTGVPHAIVGYCDLTSSNAESILQRHCQSQRMRGIRYVHYDPEKPLSFDTKGLYLSDPQWLQGLALLEKYGLSCELFGFPPAQMSKAAEVASQFPNVMFMLEHCGLPMQKDQTTMKLWKEGLPTLASFPNVYCKISGLFSSNPQWLQGESVEDIVRFILQIFGIDRCVFGSNFPIEKMSISFTKLISALMAILKPFSNEDKRKVFAVNAKKFYRL